MASAHDCKVILIRAQGIAYRLLAGYGQSPWHKGA